MKKTAWFFIMLAVLWTAAGCSETAPKTTQSDTDTRSELVVHFIDAGQADATLLEWDGYHMLIDAGDWNATDVIEYLDGQGIRKIDIAVGTHPDADHIGQLDKVIERYDVDEVWMSGNTSTSGIFTRVLEAIELSGADYVEPRSGEAYDVGLAAIEILYPEKVTGRTNEESLSLKLTYGKVDFIFTGDADTGAERDMIESGADLDAEVLQLGHHGSNTSSSPEFLKAVSPEIAIYSAGANNSYGHPHAEVLAAVENEGAETYGTDVNGTIIVTTDGETVSVKAEREGITKEGTNRCLDINRASSAELQEITGIGPALADSILESRPFGSLDELTRIKGIGDVKLQDIKEQGLACIGG